MRRAALVARTLEGAANSSEELSCGLGEAAGVDVTLMTPEPRFGGRNGVPYRWCDLAPSEVRRVLSAALFDARALGDDEVDEVIRVLDAPGSYDDAVRLVSDLGEYVLVVGDPVYPI